MACSAISNRHLFSQISKNIPDTGLGIGAIVGIVIAALVALIVCFFVLISLQSGRSEAPEVRPAPVSPSSGRSTRRATGGFTAASQTAPAPAYSPSPYGMQMPGYPQMAVGQVPQPAYLHTQASAAGWVPVASAPAATAPPQYNPEWDADGDGMPDN